MHVLVPHRGPMPALACGFLKPSAAGPISHSKRAVGVPAAAPWCRRKAPVVEPARATSKAAWYWLYGLNVLIVQGGRGSFFLRPRRGAPLAGAAGDRRIHRAAASSVAVRRKRRREALAVKRLPIANGSEAQAAKGMPPLQLFAFVGGLRFPEGCSRQAPSPAASCKTGKNETLCFELPSPGEAHRAEAGVASLWQGNGRLGTQVDVTQADVLCSGPCLRAASCMPRYPFFPAYPSSCLESLQVAVRGCRGRVDAFRRRRSGRGFA